MTFEEAQDFMVRRMALRDQVREKRGALESSIRALGKESGMEARKADGPPLAPGTDISADIRRADELTKALQTLLKTRSALRSELAAAQAHRTKTTLLLLIAVGVLVAAILLFIVL